MALLALFTIVGYVVIGLILWGITRREEMVVFWLPVVVVALWLAFPHRA